MVLLGGLEFVVGGYLIHRYHKDKNEKKKLEAEAQQRRHHTFPGPAPQSCNPYPQPQQPMMPQQKYACYAPQPQPQHRPHPQFQPQPQHRPHTAQPVPHAQTFEIPRRPLPHQQPPPQIIQPLQRTDSFATISRMPIANGSRPHNAEHQPPGLPPRPHVSNLSIPQQQPANHPYSNAGFSVSTPGLGTTPATYPTYPTGYTGQQGGRQTVDDNWETYAPQTGLGHGQGHYSPSESTALGEDDPPPPYRP
ncbi:hypothetical protein BU26DRAFT_518317 [Trematosphaeria pertusa]|uniref:PAT1 multi-domain protein n=1 Tax=Trematosphaeria pertusa TaxID=390896 RepID=A0A6A6IJL8_9PLEO|nr:uncharacterized protein BU26DRAFT_518317 [Trematosphaeria pertusa]KAF2249760.1 hypothetical protein BU26DRAFT_518317 [Trematosphaeria pertusa]